MLRKMMCSKIHRATITRCDLNYVGSITIDAELLRVSGMLPNEAVWVLDLDNGARFETYVIRGEPGSGAIEVNGAAAHRVEVGHKVIILTYGQIPSEEVQDHTATVVIADEANRVAEVLSYPSRLDEAAAV